MIGTERDIFSNPCRSYRISSINSPQIDFALMQSDLSLKDHWGQLLEAVREITCQDNGSICKTDNFRSS